jgi:protocatechuate 3,4-dioxygenase beta subunit
MNTRKLTFAGVPILFLGVIGFLLFSKDPDAGLGSDGGDGGDEAAVSASAEGGSTAGGGEEEMEIEGRIEIGLVGAAASDAAWQAALSGFKGRVVDHEKTPLADRIVRFYRLDPEILQNVGLFEADGEMPMAIDIHEARTDAEGRFLVTGAWPSAFYILEADATGDDRLTMPIDRTPDSGEIVDLGDIQLVQLGVIVGRIVDEEGQGVPDALIRAADIPGALLDMAPVERFDPEGALIVREGLDPFVVEMPAFVKRYAEIVLKPRTVTDADGMFRLRGVQPGTNVVAVTKKAFVPLVKKGVKVKSGKEKNVGKIRFREGEEALVKVVDTDDEPVPGAEVLIGATTMIFPVDFASRVGKTDDEGLVRVTGWPAGKITVAARRSRSHPWVLAEPKNVAADIEIKLPGRHHLDLRITSSAGKEIVAPKFKLLPSPDEGMTLDIGSMGFIKWLDIADKVTQQKDGRYRIEDLIPGKYILAVSSANHAASRVDFKIVKSAEASIVLRPESAFVVHVVDTEGAGVPRAKVYILTDRTENKRQIFEMPIVAGVTDKKGILRVKDGEAGTVKLSASHPAYGYAHADKINLPTADVVVLRMESPGQVAGVLRENGRIPKPGKWSVVLAPRFRGGVRGAMPDLPKFTVPDLEGNFEVTGLRPGRYRVRVVKSLTALTSPGGMIGFMMRSRLMRDMATKDIEVEAGRPTFVEIEAIKVADPVDGPSARVSGMVLVNGRPGSGLMITGRAGKRFGMTADDGGRFDLGPVRVGDLRLYVRDPNQANVSDLRMESHLWRRRFDIEEGKDLVLDIQIQTGRISGVVRTPTGAVVDTVQVRAEGSFKESGAKRARTAVALTTTDNKGRFTFESLPSGNYRVQVRHRRFGFGTSEKLELFPGGVLADVSVPLRSVHTAAGRVDFTMFGGKRPRWCYLEFKRETEAGNEGASVRRDGTFRVQALPPGVYKVILHVPDENRGSRELAVQPDVVIDDKDLKDLVLTPQRAAPTPKNPPVKRGGGPTKRR